MENRGEVMTNRAKPRGCIQPDKQPVTLMTQKTDETGIRMQSQNIQRKYLTGGWLMQTLAYSLIKVSPKWYGLRSIFFFSLNPAISAFCKICSGLSLISIGGPRGVAEA